MTESIVVPAELAAFHARFFGDRGREWAAALPRLAASYLDRWQLRLDGPPRHGMVSLVLPVLRADATPAALKLQPLDEEHAGEADGLRAWAGCGSVRLLENDPDTGVLLLERLDADRPLSTLPDEAHAVRIIAELLIRLHAVPPPPGLRRLADIASGMLEYLPEAVRTIAGEDDRRLLRDCGAVVAELVTEPGERLLHWDLHYDNVLAAAREPWLAIDPKPLVGDPGFDLMPALHNRWDEIVATGDIGRAVRRRFDLMVETVGLDRDRAVGWTLARALQNCLWNVEDGDATLDPVQVAITEALTGRRYH